MRKGRPVKPMGSGVAKGFGKGANIPRPVTKVPQQPIRQPVVPRPAITPKPVAAPRPAAVIPPRGASQARNQAREVKREVLQQAAKVNPQRPIPTVRPATPVMKIMPRKPLPMPVRPVVVRPGSAPVAGGQLPKPAAVAPRPGQVRPAPRRPAPVRPASVPSATAGATAAGVAALGALVLNTARAHPQISNEVFMLNSSLSDLQQRSSLSQVQAELTEMDSALNHLLSLLESAREKGYVFQKDLDETIYQIMDRWQPARDNVLRTIPQQAAGIRNNLMPLSNMVSRLNSVIGNPTAAQPLISNTCTQVNTLLGNVGEIERSLQSSYADIDNQAGALTSRLNTIHWALKQLEESKFKLEHNEKLVMAVQARWDQEGDDDPEGVLFLTNKRLIFERKEKVARKKLLFITVDAEFVQEVIIDQPLTDIQSVTAANKGIFGNQDFVEVQFSDKKLGQVPFHIDGQDSTYWVTLIDRAKSGEINQDQTTGSGLSYADMTGPITTADVVSIQNDVNQLQDLVTLKSVREEMAMIENETRTLERKLADLRNRGYYIEKSLDVDVAVLAIQWDRVKTNAETVLNQQVALLGEPMASIQKMMAEFAGYASNLPAARPIFMQLKSSIASTEAQADAADDAVIIQYDEYANEVDALTAHMEWIDWMLDAISTASFRLLATESGVAATEAMWERPGFEPENGILFLTDQRLLWEDRVETFELKFDLPMTEIQEVLKETDETTGQEYLKLTLSAKGPYPVTRFQLALPVGDAWLKMIGRARSGEYALDRAVEIDPAELERIRNAPRQCTNCGAGLTNTILRGQTEITCEYCGIVIPI